MWEPPPGFDDMLGDAELAPFSDTFGPLQVPDVGVVRARRPRPGAVAWLAMSVNPDIVVTDEEIRAAGDDVDTAKASARSNYLMLFVCSHLDAGEHERILEQMMLGEMSDSVFGHVARALATWGTARPYFAVQMLSFFAATHWRTIRARLINNGIGDPMGVLPSMHSLLDEAEAVWLEAVHTGDRDKDKLARDQLFDQLYAPEAAATPPPVAGKRQRKAIPVPAGFDPATVESDFNAVRRLLGAR
ncbi:DUF7240 domain-containing protein [Mycobacterium sp. LTG2003]